MRIQLLLVVFLSFPSIVQANGLCERLPLDPDVPAGLSGAYEVIGKDPRTSTPYVGTIVLANGKSSYAITRTIGKDAVHGDAWMEECGGDKIRFLVARYYTKPITQLSCRLGADGDNYYRTTCRTDTGTGRWRGLESWFQVP